MKFGICLLSVVPVRSEPSDTSEMVTQVLFGDLIVINEKINNWLKIRIVYDNYEGWVDDKQIQIIDKDEFNRLNKETSQYSLDLVEVLQDVTNNVLIPVLIGSCIRNIENNQFSIQGKKFIFSGQLSLPEQDIFINSVIENAMLFLNAPYLWGGKTPFGIDCSGFTQTVYKLSGVKLLRDASQQATQGESISLIAEAEPGDLLFFDNNEETITHVGILIGNQKVIHASGKVRIDKIDHQGIYNEDLKKYTHNLRLIKRII
ncbi:MAG: hydrolase Nlp/P60 [Bacteroidetes bacterium 4484_249]|nr:MAG: hydrolase Nlp/P60 [Bacteroidetes bacterium 4484_249]